MTVGFDGKQIPPLTDWEQFERLCCDLWREIWQDPNAQRHGRSGQRQAGVDVFGTRTSDKTTSGVQCKKRGNKPDVRSIGEKQLRAEVANAKTFKPPLKGEFVLAFTGPRDAALQRLAREISEEHRASGLFEVHVYSWDDIQELLGRYTGVWARHYADMVAAVRELDARQLLEPRMDSLEQAHLAEIRAPQRSLIVPDSAAVLDTDHSADLELVRSALRQGQPAVAVHQAEQLRARLWDAATPLFRGKLLVLTAHAELDRGNTAKAAALLIEAGTHSPAEPYLQAQASFGFSLIDDKPEAQAWSARALSGDPRDIVAIQVSILYDERSDDDVLSAHEATVGERSEIFSVLGHRALRSGDHKRALQWFNKAVDLSPDQPEVLATSAQAIIDAQIRDSSSRVGPSSTAREEIKRADDLLGTAISHLKDDHARVAHVEWFVSRVLAKRLLGSTDAVVTADEALTYCGNHVALVRLRAALASDAGDHSRVVDLLENIEGPPIYDDLGLLAAAYGNLGNLSKSIELWQQLLGRSEVPSNVRQEVRRNYVLSLLRDGREQEALKEVASALAAEPGALAPMLLAISTAERLADENVQNTRLDEALKIASDAPRDQQLQLGDALMRAERWMDAAQVYSEAVHPDSDEVFARRHVQALYNAGRFQSALARCDEIAAKDPLSRFVAEIRSSIFEKLGDLPRAIKACRDYLALGSDSTYLELRLALLLQRAGQLAESGEVLSAVKVDQITDIESSSICAQMLLRLGRKREALEVAYKMRIEHPRDLNAHLRYVSIYSDAKAIAEPGEVSEAVVESAVQLAGPGAPDWILLSASEAADVERKEYPPSHLLSKALLGKRVGDSISLGNSAAPWKISAIGTKYGFAFGRTIELFPSRFPESSAIEQHEFPEGDPERFLTDLKARLRADDDRRRKVIKDYATRHYPIGTIARVLGVSHFKALAIVSTSDDGLFCDRNLPEQRSIALKAIRASSRPLLLDLTAISTLDALGMLRDGTFASRRLLVAQRTLDDFTVEIFRWQTTPSEGAMSIGLDGDMLVRHDTTSNDIEVARTALSGLVDWLRENTDIRGVTPACCRSLRRA